MGPTLPDMPADDATSELQDAASAIVNITQHGDGFLITLADGQEIMLRPGDAHVIGPMDRQTTFDSQDGEGPQNLHEMYHKGDLPASLHQMIARPAQPTASESGLVNLPDMGGEMDPEDMLDGGADEAEEGEPPIDLEDLADGGADEAEEGEVPDKKMPAKKSKGKGKSPAKVNLPDYS